jgi:1A family penicillin-binding protein
MSSALATTERIRSWFRAPESPRKPVQDSVVYALIVALCAGWLWSAVWVGRHTLAIHHLSRGVGDTVFLSADNKPWFHLDDHRRDVPIQRITPHLRHAVVAVEDHRFYKHWGIDPIALGRAVVHNFQAHGVVEGGSTLTQQLARTLFLSNARTWGRKVKEAVLALMLEQQLSKEQILELYLNRVYMGAGRYGAEAMSEAVFGKHAADVSLPEAAFLAGLIRAPASLSPWSNFDGAVERSHTVLMRMREEGYIQPGEEQSARRARLRIGREPSVVEARGGYAKEYLRQVFRDRFGGDNPPDWQVETTFVPALQDAAERAVGDGLRRLGVPGLQAALVALDPRTGDLLALVGGRDAAGFPFNRAWRSKRQPGSAFKPLVYAVALEHGMTPVTVLKDLNAVVVHGPQEWAPTNGKESPDSQTLRQALSESNNQAAVALQLQVGTGAVRSLAGQLGLHDLPDVPSLALGTGVVSPLELTAAYAVFPNGGYAVHPHGILRVIDSEGQIALEEAPRPRRVISEESAFQTLSMLTDVVEWGTGSAARELGVHFPVGGKTGTTDDFKDAWFVGFSSEVVVGVWAGLDQPATIRENAYGARFALPIWADFMRRAARLFPPQEFEVPAGLREVELCRESYLRPVGECPTYIEYFKETDSVPSQFCPIHEGDFKERIERAMQGWLARLGRKLGHVFED